MNHSKATPNSGNLGYVYILTNPSFKEDWVKIGMTQNLEERLRTLDTTALPLPFKKYATLKTVKYQKAEKHVHHYIETFTNLRIRDKREFFNVKPEPALSIFLEVAELLEDAVVTKYDDEGHPTTIYPASSPKPTITFPVKDEQKQEQKPEPKQGPVVWLLPSNQRYFDLKTCYKKEGQVFWQIKNNFKSVREGDRGYIYSSHPDKAILYSFEVVKAHMPYSSEMDPEDKYSKVGKSKDWGLKGGLFALLKMKEVPNKGRLTLALLKQNGLKGAPQGAMILSQKKFEPLLAYIEDTPAQTVVEKVKKGIREPFRFSMIGLKEGDVITFDPTGVQVVVAGDNKTIVYEGDSYTLTGFCKKYLPDEMRTKSGAYQGPKYFSYQGKTLWEIRLEKEKE